MKKGLVITLATTATLAAGTGIYFGVKAIVKAVKTRKANKGN